MSIRFWRRKPISDTASDSAAQALVQKEDKEKAARMIAQLEAEKKLRDAKTAQALGMSPEDQVSTCLAAAGITADPGFSIVGSRYRLSTGPRGQNNYPIWQKVFEGRIVGLEVHVGEAQLHDWLEFRDGGVVLSLELSTDLFLKGGNRIWFDRCKPERGWFAMSPSMRPTERVWIEDLEFTLLDP